MPGFEFYEAFFEDSFEKKPEPKEQVSSKGVLRMIHTSGTTDGAKE